MSEQLALRKRVLEKDNNLGSNSGAVLYYTPYSQIGNRLLYTSYKRQMARDGRSSHISSLDLRSLHDHPSARRSQNRYKQNTIWAMSVLASAFSRRFYGNVRLVVKTVAIVLQVRASRSRT